MTKALLAVLFVLFMNTAQAQHIGFGNIVPIGTNTVMGNSTSATASMAALSVGGCSSATSALIWTTNTGFGCNTSITANTANTAGTVTTAAQPSVTSVANALGLGSTPSAWGTAFFDAVEGKSGGQGAFYAQTNAQGIVGFVANGFLNSSALWKVINGAGSGVAVRVQADTSANPPIFTFSGATGLTAGNTISWTDYLTVTPTTFLLPGLSTSSAGTTGTMCWTAGTGNVNVDTTTTCLLSSSKYKKAGRPLDAGLRQVLALKPVAYTLRDQYNPSGLGEQIGFFAEDVAKVDTRLVSIDDTDGTPHAVRYQQLTAVLTKAIQEQQAQISQLKRRLAALERLRKIH